MNWRQLLSLLRDAALAFSQDRAPRLAAALAYYTVFSLAPLLFLIIAITSYVLTGDDVKKTVLDYVRGYLDPGVAGYLGQLLDTNELKRSGLIATIIGVVTLFFSATGLFAQLQDALNALWGTASAPVSGVWAAVRIRLVAFAMVVFFGALMVAFLVGNTVLSALAQRLGATLGLGAFFARLGTFALGSALFTLVFATIYRFLPDVKLRWKDVWVGAMVTAALFTTGQILIGAYFARFSPASVFGAAGSLVIVLLWIYYSAQLLFFGAEVTWVYSQKYGTRAGGAGNLAKKAAMAEKGADIDPTPSPQERRAARRVLGFPSRLFAGRRASRAEQSGAEETPRPPSVWRLLGQAVGRATLSVLALPALMVLGFLRLVGRLFRRR